MNDELFSQSGDSRDEVKILFFKVDTSVYGIEINSIEEIISMEPITVIPKLPDYIRGVINLRGKAVPVYSLRMLFGLESIPFDDRNCIVIVSLSGGAQAGLIIDRIQGVDDIAKSDISKAPEGAGVNTNRYIKGVIDTDGQAKLLLDCEKIIRGSAAPHAEEKAAE